MNKPITKKQEMEFANELKKNQQKIIKRIELLKADDPFANPDHLNDNAAVDTDVREQIGHDTIEAEIEASNRHLNMINLALRKMAKGVYGVCEKCKQSIPTLRLELVPETRYCIDCEKKLIK